MAARRLNIMGTRHVMSAGHYLEGAVCTIVVDPVNGVLHGGADPRRPAYVLGW